MRIFLKLSREQPSATRRAALAAPARRRRRSTDTRAIRFIRVYAGLQNLKIMATYSTIPKDESEPLVAAAPKSASPKFKAAALMLCLASAVRRIGHVQHRVHGEVLVGARRTAMRAARETRAGPLAMIVDETIPRPRARR